MSKPTFYIYKNKKWEEIEFDDLKEEDIYKTDKSSPLKIKEIKRKGCSVELDVEIVKGIKSDNKITKAKKRRKKRT